MQIVISAAFSNPYSAYRASELLGCAGILCKHQLGRRIAHWPLAFHKQQPHGVCVHACALDRCVHHPAVVLNILSTPKNLKYTRHVLQKCHGLEI